MNESDKEQRELYRELFLDVKRYAIINNCLDLLEEIINKEMENQDRDYQEHIQRESRWKKQYNLMRNVDSVSTMKF